MLLLVPLTNLLFAALDVGRFLVHQCILIFATVLMTVSSYMSTEH